MISFWLILSVPLTDNIWIRTDHNWYSTCWLQQMLMQSKQFPFIGILEEERKEKKQQADEAAKQIKNLQGKVLCELCLSYYKPLLI